VASSVKSKFPVAANLHAEDAYVRRPWASFTGAALMLWDSFVSNLGFEALLPWARVESSLMSHFGRAEFPKVRLLLMALSLESAGAQPCD
jgi:hypothetical protein